MFSGFKGFIFGLLIGISVAGIGLFFIGRPGIKRAESDYQTVRSALTEVQRNLDKVALNAQGLTEDITAVNSRAGSAIIRLNKSTEGLDSVTEGLAGNTEQLRRFSEKVDSLESDNIELIKLGGEFDDLSWDIRGLIEKIKTPD